MRKMLEKMQQEEALKLLDDSIDLFPAEEREIPAKHVETPPIKPKVTQVRTSTGTGNHIYINYLTIRESIKTKNYVFKNV